MMDFDRKSTKADFWKEVFKLSLVITLLVVAVFAVAVLAALIVQKLGLWAILVFAIVFIVLCSCGVVYSEWRDR